MIAGISIFYYYHLYISSKGAKLFLILEVGIRAISFVIYIIETGFRSYTDLLHFVPIFLSISLYLAKGKLATFLFVLLTALIVVLLTNHIISMGIFA